MSALLADPDALFHVVAAVVLLVALGSIVHARPKVGVALFVALLALSTDLRDPVLVLQVSVAGLQIGLLDVLATVMLASAVARTAAGRVRGPHLPAISVLIGLLVLNVARGLTAHGIQLATNEARAWIYLLAALAFCAAAPIRDGRWWTGLAFVYCGWLVLRTGVGLAATGLQPVTSYVEIDGQLTDPRPVTAAAAAVLAQVMLLLVAARTHRRRDLVAVLALGGVLIALQHRSVWFAAAGGLAYLALRALRDGGRGRLAAVLAGGGAFVAGLLALLSGVAQRSAVAVSAENVTASDNTFAWRVAGWRELLQEQTTVVGALIGHPFGTGFRRVIGGQIVSVSPHNHYLETFLRFGLVGLGASILLVALAWRGAAAFGPPPPAIRSVLIVLVVFAVAYRCNPVQGILLGTVLGLSAGGRRAKSAPETSGSRVPAMSA